MKKNLRIWEKIPLQTDPSESSDEEGHFENYRDYNKVLRTWFVSFGLGVPALLLVNRDAATILENAGILFPVVTLCLFGCVSQIFTAFLNKWSSWHLYDLEVHPENESNKWYKFFEATSEKVKIDILADAITGIFFLIAIVLIVSAFIHPHAMKVIAV